MTERLIKDIDDALAFCTLEVAAEGENKAAAALNAIQEPGGIQDSINGVQASVNGVQASVNGVQASVNGLQETVDKEFDFLACPFTFEQQNSKTSIGQGCDGIDNNCNSNIGTIKRVVSRTG